MSREVSELRKISRALYYEIIMLIETSRLLYNFDSSQGTPNQLKTTKNALIESFTVHARVLLDFLYKAPKRQDVVAYDFFEDDEKDIWRNSRPKRTKELKHVHWRVGKEIVHLTYDRLDVKQSEKNWSLNIATEIMHRIRIFRRLVPEHKVNPKLLNYIDTIREDNAMPGV